MGRPRIKNSMYKGVINMNEKDLKAFVASFYTNNDDNPKSVVVIAFTLKEAQTTFETWAKARQLYDRIVSIVMQRLHKTKHNKHMFTLEFYEKQNEFIKRISEEAGLC